MKTLIANIKAKIASVDNGTLARSITLIIAIANQIVAIVGASTFATSTWYQVASIIVTVVTSIVNAWENNDWTYYAKLGTGILDALEDGKITADEVQELLNKAKDDKAE